MARLDRHLPLMLLLLLLLLLLLAHSTSLTFAVAHAAEHASSLQQSQLTTLTKGSLPPSPPSHDHEAHESGSHSHSASKSIAFEVLDELRDATHVMQSGFFEVWVGNWPRAIDWTRAVINTHLVSTIGTLSKALDRSKCLDGDIRHSCLGQWEIENEINHYFTQNIAYYFGENAFGIRYEAYDDMLWVVLGWLESVKFIDTHSRLHFEDPVPGRSGSRPSSRWHGSQFIEAFAHRSRVFYDLASEGWDDKYCGGGMVWSPWLGPYKNSVTQELFIAGSIGMYLHFSGDNNSSPYDLGQLTTTGKSGVEPHQDMYLQNAIKGYKWLNNSGMTNRKGLYVDGFHISNWKTNGTECDIRDNMVYTYNQGIVLSGLRGLWEGTGNVSYLEDGHQLIRNIIRATGWDADSSKPVKSPDWAGLGRRGIMEDHCDAAGKCSQDAQTFKGIVFHHLTLFCFPLPTRPLVPGKTYGADRALAQLHRQSCESYTAWVAHNAQAALKTRDERGRFGMWWGAEEGLEAVPLPDGAIDYRNNFSQLREPLWPPSHDIPWSERASQRFGPDSQDTAMPRPGYWHESTASEQSILDDQSTKPDLNDRGRGRTVETQAGGVAVLRCLSELLSIP